MDAARAHDRVGKLGSFPRKIWLNIALLVLAALCGGAAWLMTKPEWIKPGDIAEYNTGVDIYNELPTVRGLEIVDKASAHLEKALVGSSDDQVKALSLYNVGTMRGKLAFDDIRRIRETYAVKKANGVENDENLLLSQQELSKAIQKLAEAVRLDPRLEDAKFNLELFETEIMGGGVTGSKYSPGQVDKGY